MINRILEAICAALLLATVVIGFMAVIYRYVFDNALSWSFEALLGLLTYITFIGAYLALRKNAHLRVDLLASALPSLMNCFLRSLADKLWTEERNECRSWRSRQALLTRIWSLRFASVKPRMESISIFAWLRKVTHHRDEKN